MTAVAVTLGRIRRVIGLLIELDDPDAAWLGEVLATLVDLRGNDNASTFADAVGLPPRWRQSARIEDRDCRLRELAARHFPDLTGRPLAAAIEKAARANGRSADARAGRRPAGLQGDIFDILALGPIPCGGQLRCILNGIAGLPKPVAIGQRGRES